MPRKISVAEIVTVLRDSEHPVLDAESIAEKLDVTATTIRNYSEELEAHEKVGYMKIDRAKVYYHSDGSDGVSSQRPPSRERETLNQQRSEAGEDGANGQSGRIFGELFKKFQKDLGSPSRIILGTLPLVLVGASLIGFALLNLATAWAPLAMILGINLFLVPQVPMFAALYVYWKQGRGTPGAETIDRESSTSNQEVQ